MPRQIAPLQHSVAPPASRPLLGEHPAVLEALSIAERIAETPATVLITGESGTGKSLLARRLHESSGRRGRFVEVACGSLSDSLLESELFGHVAGAFTGAASDREGRFLQADGGTIFLDEIATASPAMQVKLLRVLQELQFEPVGGGRTHTVDVRVILATHEDLERLVAEGRFRADLYWRINVVAIEMPALRSRASDVPLLADHFLRMAASRTGRQVEGFTSAAVEALLAHPWPGNVRELQHAVERGVFLGRGPLVDVCDLPVSIAAPQPIRGGQPASSTPSLKTAMAQPERQLILAALERNGWRRDAAARSLGINRTTLYKKLKRLGMDLADHPAGAAAWPTASHVTSAATIASR
jgi:DNA-binding NtrC family response regulator